MYSPDIDDQHTKHVLASKGNQLLILTQIFNTIRIFIDLKSALEE